LSNAQTRSLSNSDGPAILISFWTAGIPCATLGHEIGHHIYRLARFSAEEENAPVSGTMRGFFPTNTYAHQSRDGICAECLANYLTVVDLRRTIRCHCDRILQRVRIHDPHASNLVERYRTSFVSKKSSRSTLNGKPACRGEARFEENEKSQNSRSD